jgi:hypothetical protein
MSEEKLQDLAGDGSRLFGMTQSEIAAVADALSQQKDQNHPNKSGSYQELIESVRVGREALSTQDSYCQNKP